jgi:hypothetical protein
LELAITVRVNDEEGNTAKDTSTKKRAAKEGEATGSHEKVYISTKV